MCQTRNISTQQNILTRNKGSHDTENHCGYLNLEIFYDPRNGYNNQHNLILNPDFSD